MALKGSEVTTGQSDIQADPAQSNMGSHSLHGATKHSKFNSSDLTCTSVNTCWISKTLYKNI